MTETITRRCGYSQCGNEFTYAGKGRPAEYCAPDGRPRRWPELGNRTCKALAADERAAAHRSGLEEVLARYASAEDPVLSAISALTGALAEHAERGQAVVEAVDGRVRRAEEER